MHLLSHSHGGIEHTWPDSLFLTTDSVTPDIQISVAARARDPGLESKGADIDSVERLFVSDGYVKTVE